MSDEPVKEAVNAITVEPAPDHKPDPVENLVVETYQPKKNCRKCFGRGVIGYIEGDPNKPYYCTCIVKVKKEFTPAQAAAYKKATTPSVVIQDNTVPATGPGPCPAGMPGVEGSVGANDPQASV